MSFSSRGMTIIIIIEGEEDAGIDRRVLVI